MNEDQDGIKSQSWGGSHMDPPLQYSRIHKRLSLGMPKASPSSSTIINFTHGTIFLFLYTLSGILGASVCFYFQFVIVFFSRLCNKLDSCMLVWERGMIRFFIRHSCSSLICVECLAFLILASSSYFSCISCSELLAFVLRKYSLVFSPFGCFK